MNTKFFRCCRAFPFMKSLAWVIAFMVINGSAVAQTASKSERDPALKLGYVDSQVIIQQYPEAQEAQKKIQASLQLWQAQLDTMVRSYQSHFEDYDKKKAMMNEQAKLAEEQKLLAEQQKINDFRSQKLGQDGELAQLQERVMTPVKDKILKAIEAVAKEEGMSFVFDKGSELAVLLYGAEKFDVTFKVLDRLKRGR